MEQSDHDVLIEIATTVNAMHHRLFGNGNPGELDEAKRRIADLESFKNMLIGALSLLSVITTVSTGTLIYHIILGGK
jgi:hypothetical protein